MQGVGTNTTCEWSVGGVVAGLQNVGGGLLEGRKSHVGVPEEGQDARTP